MSFSSLIQSNCPIRPSTTSSFRAYFANYTVPTDLTNAVAIGSTTISGINGASGYSLAPHSENDTLNISAASTTYETGAVTVTGLRRAGRALGLYVTDADLNLNSSVRESLVVTVTSNAHAEIEVVVLNEVNGIGDTGQSLNSSVFYAPLDLVAGNSAGAFNDDFRIIGAVEDDAVGGGEFGSLQ